MIVKLPQLSLAMEVAKIGRWLVADGALVSAGQPILEIETDKAITEIEAPLAGTVRQVVAEGTVVPVESTLAEIVEISAAPPPAISASPPTEERPTVVTSPEQRVKADIAPSAISTVPDHKHHASPAARRIARERGIDLGQISDISLKRRITAHELEAMTSGVKSSLREAVVAHVTACWRGIPHIHVGGELNGTGLAAAKRAAPPGVTITDLLVVAIVGALREVPELNGTMGKPSRVVHLSLAVATPSGVIAPVIRQASDLSLLDIARERARLVAAARAGTSESRDLAGGTMTLTNLGGYPVDFFAPIVSGPQIAMLATGRLAERPFALNHTVSVRNQIWVNMAIDHRAADGVSGARFLAALEHCMNTLPC